MSITNNNQVSIQLLGKNFTIRCPEGKQAELQEAVIHLTQHLHNIRVASKVADLEQLLVIGALNMTYELLAEKRETNIAAENIAQRLQLLQQAVADTLLES